MTLPQDLEQAIENREHARVNWTRARRSIDQRVARIGPHSVTQDERARVDHLLKIFRAAMIERDLKMQQFFEQKHSLS